jgi:hypothetical protein
MKLLRILAPAAWARCIAPGIRGWSAEFHRADLAYGSDHYPLIATVTLP